MSPRARLLIAMVSTGVVGYIAIGSVLGRVFGDTTYGQLAVFNEVVRIVLEAYVEPVNLDRAMGGAEQGLTDALDGDSAFIKAEDWKALQQTDKNADADIGVVLGRRFSFLTVIATRPGSPAEKAGLRAGDYLKTIEGRHTRPLSVGAGERLLSGAPGSVVKLKVLRAGADALDFQIVRERVQPALPAAKMLADGIGYIKVAEFSPKTADDVRAELEALQKNGARKLVLDLRGAALGAPGLGIKLANLFVKEGTLGSLSGRKFTEQAWNAEPALVAWTLPMATLIGSSTAGPGEVAAAALLDSGRAQLVGQRTFGRAGQQKAIPIEDGMLVLTVAKFNSPKGNAIHGKGVEPNVVVRAARAGHDDVDQTPEDGSDPVLDKALEVLGGGVKKAA